MEFVKLPGTGYKFNFILELNFLNRIPFQHHNIFGARKAHLDTNAQNLTRANTRALISANLAPDCAKIGRKLYNLPPRKLSRVRCLSSGYYNIMRTIKMGCPLPPNNANSLRMYA